MLAATLLCAAAGYLIGAIPFGLLVGRMKGVDIRRMGSGNIGATNAGRVLGFGYGLLVFVLDLLKGLLPTLAAVFILWRVGPSDSAAATGLSRYLLGVVTVATACVLGHMFPVYIGFKGGKGVATAWGALLGIYPYFTLVGIIVLGIWLVLTLATRYVSVGSIVGATAFPILFALFASMWETWWGPPHALWPLYIFSAVVAGLVVYRHRSNLLRLWQGVEPRWGASSQQQP
jgi:acyl phosphate:glycerol-3-phosphate acyltransferase